MTPGPGRLGPARAAARTDATGTMWRLRRTLLPNRLYKLGALVAQDALHATDCIPLAEE